MTASAAHRAGLEPRTQLVVRLAGNEPTVRALRAVVAELGDFVALDHDAWAAFRALELPGAAVRISAAPARIAEVWAAALALAGQARDDAPGPSQHGVRGAHDEPSSGGAGDTLEQNAALVTMSVQRGVARVQLPLLHAQELLGRAGRPALAAVARRWDRLPAVLWPLLAPSAAADRLSRGVRRAFDPQLLLNPGILGELDAEGRAADATDRQGTSAGTAP